MPRAQNVAMTKGLIQDYFEQRNPPVSQHGTGLIIRFENALRRSKVETAAYECKQGIVGLDLGRTPNADILGRLVETVCGIANIGPDSTGAVFIGVADGKADELRIRELDGIVPLSVGSRHVVGVDRELQHIGIDLEAYKRRVVDHFAASGLSEPLRSAVLGTIDLIDYRGHSVLCVWVPSQQDVSDVADTVFVRRGSSTVAIEGFKATRAIEALFTRQHA